MAPCVCHCAKNTCGAPKPEWCIGRRYADGFRAVAERKYALLVDKKEVVRKGSEKECWEFAVHADLAEWVGEGLIKLKVDSDVHVLVIEK